MFRKIIPVFVFIFLLIGCSAGNSEPTESVPTPPIIIESTPTQRPMALIVNGEGVWLEEYQAGMQQIQHAQSELGINLSVEEASNRVIEDLVQTTLLTQAAYQNGYAEDEQSINQKIAELTEGLGGTDAFNSWLSQNGYTNEIFLHAFKKAEAAGWQIDLIISSVSLTAEQIHARQIISTSRENIDEAYNQLENGYDFLTLAKLYDPLTGGDLGWFPRGYLLQPLLEDAAFNLDVGSYSSIIETSSGFHIVYVIAREAEHPLSQDALLTMQDNAIKRWMDEKVLSSTIELFVP